MRKLATIQKIKKVINHPNADKLDILSFENIGWQCISKRDEFKENDLCVYFEIDSLIPMKHEWARFLQDKNKPSSPARLKTIRLRGEISQGLAVPIDILMAYKDQLDTSSLEQGQDVTELLEIKKYEPKIPACLSGDVKGTRPSYTPKTDEDRIQAFPGLIEEFQGVLVYIAQKIDGTSGTFVYNNEFDVCGRNWSYKEDKNNTYWKIADKYDIRNKLEGISNREGINYAIQGEVAGPGIQKNRLGLKDHELFVFNVIELSKRRYLDFEEFKEFCDALELQTVPIIDVCNFKWETIDELLELAKGKYSSGKDQEGVVIRPIREFISRVLNGRASFKVINNDFLIGGGE